MNTSRHAKINTACAVAGVALGAAGLLADHFSSSAADWIAPASAATFGLGAILAAWAWLRPGRHPILQRNLLLGLLAVITTAGTALAWPDPETEISPADAKNISTEGITVTKIGGNSLPLSGELPINACLTVSGKGSVPSGYGIWVANNRDVDGEPGTDGYWSLQRAKEGEEKTWHTGLFGIGNKKGDEGGYFWVHVLLLPKEQDEALSNVSGDAPGLKGRPAGSKVVGKYRVKRTAVPNCPWF
ncbi:hypothetical protein ACIPSE_37935 [Streptomyces sp. NPDC090106]|uniref:hypothetical protein n=1 Tax=Streptomyces sp. NPDC090106 TaxID=3365946 RepID=UPI003812BF6E